MSQTPAPDASPPHAGHRSAMSLGLMRCHTCHLLSHAGDADPHHLRCPRCNTPLHFRRPGSLSSTWALTIAALLLYIPANTLPIMVTASFIGAQADTIMSGVLFLWVSGSWPLAVVVFVASVMVPLMKILALLILLLSVQFRWSMPAVTRTRLYRLVELVGKWSMLDIYVIALLVALVRFEGLATVEAGPAALAFGAVVVLTMFAAMSFDPRLLWDTSTPEPETAPHRERT